jgi:hypothetical protein
VNNLNLEPQSMNSGIERAALMVSEEKQDSRKNFITSHCHLFLFNYIIFFNLMKYFLIFGRYMKVNVFVLKWNVNDIILICPTIW